MTNKNSVEAVLVWYNHPSVETYVPLKEGDLEKSYGKKIRFTKKASKTDTLLTLLSDDGFLRKDGLSYDSNATRIKILFEYKTKSDTIFIDKNGVARKSGAGIFSYTRLDAFCAFIENADKEIY